MSATEPTSAATDHTWTQRAARAIAEAGRIFRTTAVKLALVYLVVFSIVSVALVLYIARSTTSILTSELRNSVDQEVADLQDQYSRGGILRVVRVLDARSRQPGASLYLMTDTAGQALLGNISDLPPGVISQAQDATRTVPYRRLNQLQSDRTNHLALVRVITLDSGFRVLVGRDISEREKFTGLMWDAMRAVLVVTVFLGLVTWWFVSRSVLKRIEHVAVTTNQIVAGDLSSRLIVTGSNDEFDRLSIGLNHMLDRISELMRGLKEVSDNIAHDLKTPLTRLRNRAEEALMRVDDGGAARAALEGVIEDCDGLIRTFDALLTIARVEAGHRTVEMGPVDVAAIAVELAELYEPTAEECGATLSVDNKLWPFMDGAGPVLVIANRELLAQVLANLLDNALKYGKPLDGEAHVRLELVARGRDVQIAVVDNGPGIPAHDRERVLNRFVRLEASRNSPGSGLGLSLVAAIVRQLGSALVLADAAPGLRISFTLPQPG